MNTKLITQLKNLKILALGLIVVLILQLIINLLFNLSNINDPEYYKQLNNGIEVTQQMITSSLIAVLLVNLVYIFIYIIYSYRIRKYVNKALNFLNDDTIKITNPNYFVTILLKVATAVFAIFTISDVIGGLVNKQHVLFITSSIVLIIFISIMYYLSKTSKQLSILAYKNFENNNKKGL